MILHGILATEGIFDWTIHEIKKISEFDVKKENRQINWHKTQVFDNSNRGREK